MNRPEPTRNGVTFDLEALVESLRREEAYARVGHTARTLVRDDDLRVVIVAIREGGHITSHRARGTVSVQALSGRLRLELPAAPVEIEAGRLLVLAEGLEHDVRALSDSAFLLTLGWPARPGQLQSGTGGTS